MTSTDDFLADLLRSRRQASGSKPGLSPFQRLVLAFAVLIGAGALLLLLPWSVPAGTSIHLIDALFTATSAVCVTGLIVQDTATAFSPFGQAVILALIQLGGLGYMMLATASAVLLGRRFGMTDKAAIQQAMNLETSEGLGRFVRTVLAITVSCELVGAVVLTLAYWSLAAPGKAMALGIFHAVSAFNNAGFSLFSDNLAGAGGRPLAAVTVAVLVVLGGLGFFVLNEFVGLLRGTRQRLSIHAKLVLIASGLLMVLGAAGLQWTDRMGWGHALFLSVSARTAGFNLLEIGGLPASTLFLLIPLMFIGASPGGTGGGIKTTTFSLVLMSIWATLRGKQDVEAFHRRLPAETMYKALLIMVAMIVLLVTMTLILMALESRHVIQVLFESASALGTVGLSTGNGGNLSLCALFSAPGKAVVIAGMFIGRLGPLTLGLAAAYQAFHPQVKYPEGRVSIG